MRRLCNAFREWLLLRARVREERRFHIEQSAADLRGLGLSRSAARKAARLRFGARRNLRVTRREIGGDGAGLVRLFRAHRVMASAWLQPNLLLAAIALTVLLSPAPRVLTESIIGIPLSPESRQTVFLSAPAPWPLFTGFTPREFEALRSMSLLTSMERYQMIYVRGRAGGAPLAAIQAEARARSGNPNAYAFSEFERTRIEMGPALAAWIVIAFLAAPFLVTRLPQIGKLRWLLYGVFTLGLHLAASMIVWALAIQIWMRIQWPSYLPAGLSPALLLLVHLLAAGSQYSWWKRDLSRRCPVCLDRFLLVSTEGGRERVLLSVAVTESVCAHGHGVCVETRWARQFRREDSLLETLIHA